MQRLSRLLILPAVLIAANAVQAGCPAGGCAHPSGCGAIQGCGPYWCDPYANLSPWPNNNPYYTARNWAWWYPHGGFTAYPGQSGSGIRAVSDYSHVNWVVPPTTNAQLVVEKLQSIGVPLGPQETIYLGKNPGAVEKAKLPTPKSWIEKDDPNNAEVPKVNDPDKDQ